jgi:hypothetical protein
LPFAARDGVLLAAVDGLDNLISCVNQGLSLRGGKGPLTGESSDLIYEGIKHVNGRFDLALIELLAE